MLQPQTYTGRLSADECDSFSRQSRLILADAGLAVEKNWVAEILTEVQIALIAEITAAFDGVPRGNGMTLQQSTWCGKWVYCGRDESSDEAQAEYRQMTASVRDTAWQEITDDVLETNTSLSYLDEAGFRYYLPAFMCWTVKRYPPDWETMDTASSAVYGLCWSRQLPAPGPFNLARFSALNVAQSKAALRFLQYILTLAQQQARTGDKRDIRHALNGYWLQFERMQLERPKKKRPGKK